MNRNFIIIYKTFYFLIVMLILYLTDLLFFDFNNWIYLGWLIGSVFTKFWSKPLYIDQIEAKNSILTINFINPLLKKGIEEYDVEKISNIRIKNQTFSTKYGKFEFDFDGLHKKYACLKKDHEMVITKITELLRGQKLVTTHRL